jgi:hypothetical protein
LRDHITIDRRFHGPPRSGNGGYVAGRIASFIESPCVVRLLVPPPLETPLAVDMASDSVTLTDGGAVVATARAADVSLEIPTPVDFERACAASRGYRGFDTHPFPSCFVCGPERERGDGLRIFPGPIERGGLVACPWIPDASLAAPDGRVAQEFVWAALDCPGAFAFAVQPDHVALLGELAAAVSDTVEVGERCTLTAWEISRDGRKHFTGSALFGESRDCRALARATWFEVPTPSV